LSDKPPFDLLRAAFWLVAMVIIVECFVVVAGSLTCLYFAATIISDPNIKCDPDGRLFQLLGAALAAALAFFAGAQKKDHDRRDEE
jgi:hypothetical protein